MANIILPQVEFLTNSEDMSFIVEKNVEIKRYTLSNLIELINSLINKKLNLIENSLY